MQASSEWQNPYGHLVPGRPSGGPGPGAGSFLRVKGLRPVEDSRGVMQDHAPLQRNPLRAERVHRCEVRDRVPAALDWLRAVDQALRDQREDRHRVNALLALVADLVEDYADRPTGQKP